MDSQTGSRELVYCHRCENEWYRDEHGLQCPECQSEFTEIIEADHDPRIEEVAPELPPGVLAHLHQDYDDDHEPHPLHDHNPWSEAPDPDEEDINNFQWRQSGPGRFRIQGHYITTWPPQEGRQQQPGAPQNDIFQNFATMVQGITGGAAINPQRQEHGNEGDNEGVQQDQRTANSPSPGVRLGRGVIFSSNARIFPRDANQNQPHVEPVDNLNNVLGQLFGQLSQPPPQGQNYAHTHDQHPDAGNPLAALFASLFNAGFPPAHGDAVYSQEQLDRVITQLMEQNATGNAPGPASPEAIAALPKKPVTKDMLGSEGKAECSICMDEVAMGEEVTFLPVCGHWFHGTCVGAWLSEHDTCPHCRRGIGEKDPTLADTGARSGAESSRSPNAGADAGRNEGAAASGQGFPYGRTSPLGSSSPSGAGPEPMIPGAWGTGTIPDSYVVYGSPQAGQQGRQRAQREDSTEDGGGGGIGNRLRNMFGGGGGS